jgi:hypothetical protein
MGQVILVVVVGEVLLLAAADIQFKEVVMEDLVTF